MGSSLIRSVIADMSAAPKLPLATQGSHGIGLQSTKRLPTTVVSKTDVGGEIREKVSAALLRFPTKSIEAGGDLSDEGVRLLKNGKRTISLETAVKMARAKGELGPAMWAVICDLCGRSPERIEHESPRLNAMFGALDMLSRGNGPEASFARALIKQMNEAKD